MRYRVFRTGDHWVVAVHVGEHDWRVVDRADDEADAIAMLDGYGRKKAS